MQDTACACVCFGLPLGWAWWCRFAARRGVNEADRVLPYLSLAQLQLLVQRVPALALRAAFVNATVAALKPSESLAGNPAGRAAYLAALDALVAPLPPAYNNIRLCILYNKVCVGRWGRSMCSLRAVALTRAVGLGSLPP